MHRTHIVGASAADGLSLLLDHLERRHDRRFNTVWSFVRFAEAEGLGLDFTTPPVRPDPDKLKFPCHERGR